MSEESEDPRRLSRELNASFVANYDFFAGAVPPGLIFQLETDDLLEIVESRSSQSSWTGLSRLAIIGLVASFEAFCRGLFSAAINIDPNLVHGLSKAQYDTSVKLESLLILDVPTTHRLGFFLGERLNLNEPKKVNAAFCAILKVSPMSKEDMKHLNRLLEERHLLVHHGGLITSRYHASKLRRREISDRLHVDTLEISKDEVRKHVKRLRTLAHKMVTTVARAMRERSKLPESNFLPVQREAVEMIEWWEPEDESSLVEPIE